MTDSGSNTMVSDINRILTDIQHKAELVEELYARRLQTIGVVREAYTEVLKTELYIMMRKIDEYKMIVLSKMDEVNTEAVMNISFFPNLAK